MLSQINIQTIPHTSQRYDTVGDYWEDGDTLQVRISDMGNWKYQVLVAIHELIEYFLCASAGIRETDITAFDEAYEVERTQGLHSDTDEPGFDPRAPYRTQHSIASFVEYGLCPLIGVDTDDYNKTIVSLEYNK